MTIKQTTLDAAILVALLLSAALANAADDTSNPLHPQYFANRSANTITQYVGANASESYVDRHNPLHPGYGQGSTDSTWTPAALADAERYADSSNPLYPMFGK